MKPRRFKKKKKEKEKKNSRLNYLLTSRFGSGEDKLCCAAGFNLVIAGMNVDAVNCKWLQAKDLQFSLCH